MAVFVKLEHNLLQLCLVGAAGITYILGLIIHFFMVGVSFIDWLKGRPLTTVDHLIIFIATSRIISQVVSLFHVFWIFFNGKFSAAYDIAIAITGSSSVDCNMWLSVLLSVFYSLKISNIHNSFFTKLKTIILQRVFGLIAVFVLLSIGSISVEALTTYMTIPRNLTQEANLHISRIINFRQTQTSITYLVNFVSDIHHVSVNSTHDYLDQPVDAAFGIFLAGILGPLLILLLSSVLLMISLYFHIKQMKCNGKGTCSLDVYYRIITYITGSIFTSALCVIGSGLTKRCLECDI
ncbi:taste receptor type 2 member 14-like [Anomaloglossus baeobatrachus]|uniref:taste receptor type 2 member 14-like n=1 Tax=Anomaloglossus baeobatrachus TaxID=238106 RepID=UPI003F4FE1AB